MNVLNDVFNLKYDTISVLSVIRSGMFPKCDLHKLSKRFKRVITNILD